MTDKFPRSPDIDDPIEQIVSDVAGPAILLLLLLAIGAALGISLFMAVA